MNEQPLSVEEPLHIFLLNQLKIIIIKLIIKIIINIITTIITYTIMFRTCLKVWVFAVDHCVMETVQ